MTANLESAPFLGTAWHGKAFAAGGWRALEGGTQPIREPATGDPLGERAVALPSDLDRAVREAAAAQPAWAAQRPEERRAVLLAVARLLQEHADEVAGWLIREGGSVPAKAGAEIELTGGEILEAASLPTQAYGIVYPSATGDRRSVAERVPLGVVGVITPWNFPLILAMRAVAPAIALGNAVILKPDHQTTVGGGIVLARLFQEAGLPPSILQVLPGGADTGAALVEHPGVAMISFTGSSAVGRKVGAVAGGMLKRISLELGGNNAFIVLDDADVEIASSNGAWGSYLHQGQICMAAGRHLVHASIADEYIARLVERARRLPAGDPHRAPVALGPLINEKQLGRVDRIVKDSVEAGAEVRAGGSHEGLFYAATVLAGVVPGMPAFDEEIFGPVAPVTIFHDDDEAVALANASPYGLSAAVQSASPARALRLARRLRSGMVHVNDQTVNVDAIAPFGGMGASGNGSRYGRTATLDEFTQWQWITIKDAATPYPF